MSVKLTYMALHALSHKLDFLASYGVREDVPNTLVETKIESGLKGTYFDVDVSDKSLMETDTLLKIISEEIFNARVLVAKELSSRRAKAAKP